MKAMKIDPYSFKSRCAFWGLGYTWFQTGRDEVAFIVDREKDIMDSCRYRTGLISSLFKSIGQGFVGLVACCFVPLFLLFMSGVALVMHSAMFLIGNYYKAPDFFSWFDPESMIFMTPLPGLHYKDFVFRPVYLLFLVWYVFYLLGAPPIEGVAYFTPDFWSSVTTIMISMVVGGFGVLVYYFVKDRSKDGSKKVEKKEASDGTLQALLKSAKERTCRKVDFTL